MTEIQVAEAKVARAEKIKRALITVTAVLVLACLGLLVVLLGQVRNTQLEGSPTGKRLLESSDRVLDCTDAGDPTSDPPRPAGDCYVQNQKRTRDVVGDIGATNILAVVCALDVPDGTPTDRALRQVTKCVTDRLAAKS